MQSSGHDGATAIVVCLNGSAPREDGAPAPTALPTEKLTLHRTPIDGA